MALITSISEAIGNTPLVELRSYGAKLGLNARILAKAEFMNPAGSVKERVAKAMIEAAERSGELKQNSVIIEPTSGNTGIGLAAVAATKGYKVILTMPETMSVERRKLLAAYGAEIVLTDGKLGMAGAIEKAKEIAINTAASFIPAQFDNPVNPDVHYRSTAPEIWRDTDGRLDIFVSAAGTGGTVSGCGRYFKEKNKNIKIVAVEPQGSPVLSKGISGTHGIQGIGAGFVPDVLDRTVIDEVVAVSDEAAYDTGRILARSEGFIAGISSGAAVFAATELACRQENAGKTIVVILPDSGDRYLSTPLFG